MDPLIDAARVRIGDAIPNVRELLACWPKTQHATRAEAEAHRQELTTRYTRDDADVLRSYACRHCGQWHVGHHKFAKAEDNMTRAEIDRIVAETDQEFRELETRRTPSYEDFLHDTPLAKAHRAKHAVTKATPEGMTAPLAPQDTSATSEFEHLLALRLNEHPAETRAVATNEVFRANEGLYDRYRREHTLDTHGRTLSETYGRATASFGVDAQGREVTKADVEAEMMRRAAMVLAKAAHDTTLDAAVAAVFASDPALYERHRRASYA